MNTDNSFFSIFSQNLIERTQLSSIRGGSGSGGILQDEDILLPDPEPGDKQS